MYMYMYVSFCIYVEVYVYVCIVAYTSTLDAKRPTTEPKETCCFGRGFNLKDKIDVALYACEGSIKGWSPSEVGLYMYM